MWYLQVCGIPQQRCSGAVGCQGSCSQAAVSGAAAGDNYGTEALARALRPAHAVHAEGSRDTDSGTACLPRMPNVSQLLHFLHTMHCSGVPVLWTLSHTSDLMDKWSARVVPVIFKSRLTAPNMEVA